MLLFWRLQTYGAEAITIIRQDPYRLAKDIRGIGFRSADKIAQNVGILPESLIRARAGIRFALFGPLVRKDRFGATLWLRATFDGY